MGVAMLPALPLDPLQAAAFVVVTAGMAISPDLDHPSSMIARTFGWPTQWLAEKVARYSGGHRKGTHSLVFCLVCGLVGLVLLLLGPVGQAVAVGLPLGLGARALGWTRTKPLDNLLTIAGCGALAFATVGYVNVSWIPVAWALGAFAHIFGDWHTKQGVPWLWPRRRMYRVAYFTTGSGAETVLVGMWALMVAGGYGFALFYF